MNKLIFSLALFACSVLTVQSDSTATAGPTTDPNAYPVPAPEAKVCIDALNHSGVIDQCHTQALNLWNPAKRGESVSSMLDFCCAIYEEISCMINATVNGNYCKNDAGEEDAAQNHFRTVFSWWKRNDCQSISYQSGQCDPDKRVFPPPQPREVSKCNDKLYNKVNHCEEDAKRDWNVKSTDMYSSQSVCCSRYQINDCLVQAAKDICTAEEFKQYHLYYYNLDTNISAINCTNYPYQSIGCLSKNSAFPPAMPPLALSCTEKIPEVIGQCEKRVTYEWNINVKSNHVPIKGWNTCCGAWDVFDCIVKGARDKCELKELSQVEQYFNVMSQQIINVNCTDYPYHSDICKGKNPRPAEEVVNCLTKIDNQTCYDQYASKKWHVNGQKDDGDSSLCCSQLFVSQCLEKSASSKCNSTELVMFQKYMSKILNAKCGHDGYGIDQCNKSSMLISGWILLVITLIYLLI